MLFLVKQNNPIKKIEVTDVLTNIASFKNLIACHQEISKIPVLIVRIMIPR